MKGLTFSTDVTWSHIEQHNQGLAGFSATALAKPSALYEFKSQNNALALIRAQRNFGYRSSNRDLTAPPARNRRGLFCRERWRSRLKPTALPAQHLFERKTRVQFI